MSKKKSWEQISTMTAIKDISMGYDHECWCSSWVYFGGNVEILNHNAITDYSEFIDALSDSSTEKEDRLKRITWACADIPRWGRGDLLDQYSWISYEKLDGERMLMKIAYSWCTVKAFLCHYSMYIRVERHGRVTA